jgi:hypothetical protein
MILQKFLVSAYRATLKNATRKGESFAGVREVDQSKLDIEPELLKPIDDRLLPHITIALMATIFKMSAE